MILEQVCHLTVLTLAYFIVLVNSYLMLFILKFFAVKQMQQKQNEKEYSLIKCQCLTFQHVSKAITVEVVQAYAARIVSSLEFVTCLQVIVTEGVHNDGQEANVINVKLVFLKFHIFLIL